MEKFVNSYEYFTEQSDLLLKKIEILIDDILHIYQHIQINKKICSMLLDRIEVFMNLSKFQSKEWLTKSYKQLQYHYNTLHQLVYLLEEIKEFVDDMSNLKKFRKYLNIEQKFMKIIERFDEICIILRVIDSNTLKEINTQKEMRCLRLDLANNKQVKQENFFFKKINFKGFIINFKINNFYM